MNKGKTLRIDDDIYGKLSGFSATIRLSNRQVADIIIGQVLSDKALRNEVLKKHFIDKEGK